MSGKMHVRVALLCGVVTAVGAIAVSPATAGEETSSVLAFGRSEFMTNCAACHGAEGKGDGPVANQLSNPPSDLTRLMADNGGTFPFFETYEMIEGVKDVAAHGKREMPVWGHRFRVEAARKLSLGPFCRGEDVDEMVQGRILRLVYYLRSIQVEPTTD